MDNNLLTLRLLSSAGFNQVQVLKNLTVFDLKQAVFKLNSY
jgi:hypothetical protein